MFATSLVVHAPLDEAELDDGKEHDQTHQDHGLSCGT
jgi:hypothetical protein